MMRGYYSYFPVLALKVLREHKAQPERKALLALLVLKALKVTLVPKGLPEHRVPPGHRVPLEHKGILVPREQLAPRDQLALRVI
jgi:hypothetical protein